MLFGLPRAAQTKRYCRPLRSRARSFAVFFGSRKRVFRPAIENERARLPRLTTLNSAAPARGRFGATAQLRSVIVTRIATAFAEPSA
jgi:hypothetical protein